MDKTNETVKQTSVESQSQTQLTAYTYVNAQFSGGKLLEVTLCVPLI